MRVLVTGGCGFIGSHVVRLLMAERPDWEVLNLDALTYAADPERLSAIARDPRYTFVHGDVADPEVVRPLYARGLDGVLHLAAESHVDRSIADAGPFIHSNVRGTQVLLDAAREFGVGHHVQISTDEVYGDLGPDDPPFVEDSPLRPSNPYAASKASGDLLCGAFARTHGLPVSVTRGCNNYGPDQHAEKLIPTLIRRARAGQSLPLYGDGRQIRDWIHVTDHARALLHVLEGEPGRTWLVGARNERSNREVAELVLRLLGRPERLIASVADRPGHDRRYGVDPSRLMASGWSPRVSWEEGMAALVGA